MIFSAFASLTFIVSFIYSYANPCDIWKAWVLLWWWWLRSICFMLQDCQMLLFYFNIFLSWWATRLVSPPRWLLAADQISVASRPTGAAFMLLKYSMEEAYRMECLWCSQRNVKLYLVFWLGVSCPLLVSCRLKKKANNGPYWRKRPPTHIINGSYSKMSCLKVNIEWCFSVDVFGGF